jgi:hypothetical protein
VTALADRHPELAERFTALRDEVIRSPSPPPGRETTLGDAIGTRNVDPARVDLERRRAAASAFDDVIAEIRRLPDFHDFLRPAPVSEHPSLRSTAPRTSRFSRAGYASGRSRWDGPSVV